MTIAPCQALQLPPIAIRFASRHSVLRRPTSAYSKSAQLTKSAPPTSSTSKRRMQKKRTPMPPASTPWTLHQVFLSRALKPPAVQSSPFSLLRQRPKGHSQSRPNGMVAARYCQPVEHQEKAPEVCCSTMRAPKRGFATRAPAAARVRRQDGRSRPCPCSREVAREKMSRTKRSPNRARCDE